MAREKIDFDAEVIHETASAWLLDIDGNEVWVPKSQVQDNGDGTFSIPEWLAIEKGLPC